jgi:predicted AAA+ superfamily ATPase
MNVLEVTAQVFLIPPFYENLGKRLVKAPKVFLADSGLACHLLGIESEDELERSPFLGPVFEGFVAAEILKAQAHSGLRRELYYYRDRQGLEVDFLVPTARGGIRVLEVKATRTPVPDMARGLVRIADALRVARRGNVDAALVHRPARRNRSVPAESSALVPGVMAVAWPDFLLDPLA